MKIKIAANITCYRMVDIPDAEPFPDFWARESIRLIKEALDEDDYATEYVDHDEAGEWELR